LSVKIDVDRMTQWAQRLADQDPEQLRTNRHWMEAMGPMIRSLLADEYFVPTFGVKFEELNETDRYVLTWLVQRRGRGTFLEYVELPEPLFGISATGLAKMFGGKAPNETSGGSSWYPYHIALYMVDQ